MSIKLRAARSTEEIWPPPSWSPARPITSRASSRISASSRRRGSSHAAPTPGSSPRLAMFSGTWASAQAALASPRSSASLARRTSAPAASKSIHAGSGRASTSSSRPARIPLPRPERSRESSVRSAPSWERGALSGQTASISSSRPTERLRLSTR